MLQGGPALPVSQVPWRRVQILSVICVLDTYHLSQVPGCPLLAGGLSPVHVFDGAAPQNSTLQLPDRGPGLRWCPPGADLTGEGLLASGVGLWLWGLGHSGAGLGS